ncbi:MAG TPA: division/cell wall cluster transcriptional repressor MraZ [Gaiellaceae bacterium]|nr:division/cell wall cluster transcriptional repressor MraZ [Gaiellaceae bacterium]
MFFGEYEHTIDEKSRLTLPARFRPELARGVVLTRGIDRNVDVYPREAWERNVARVAELDPFTREGRDMKRHAFVGATVTELDRQGRVVLPQRLVEYASLGREVVVLGVHDHLEVWDRDAWAAHASAIEGSVGDAAERLAARHG